MKTYHPSQGDIKNESIFHDEMDIILCSVDDELYQEGEYIQVLLNVKEAAELNVLLAKNAIPAIVLGPANTANTLHLFAVAGTQEKLDKFLKDDFLVYASEAEETLDPNKIYH